MQYASFGRRAAALLIDALIISALSAFFMRFFVPIALVLHFFYKPIFEASNVRATPGKYLAEISVERSDGTQLSFKDSYIRYFSSLISDFTCGLGYLIALFNPRHQTLHDMFADSVVVNKVYDNNGLWNEWLSAMKRLFGKKN